MRLSQLKSMSENQNKQEINLKRRKETAAVVADIAHVTPAYVRMVMNGDKENEKILTATVMYEQGKSKLIKAIEKAVPFN